MSKNHIFINYRQSDSAHFVGRLYSELTARYARETVFMDVTGIESGLDFLDVIERAVRECDVLLAVIGSNWAGREETAGGPVNKIDDRDDFVRVEISTALKRNVRVIPILLEETVIPAADQLPKDLKPLSRRNARRFSHHRFDSDLETLCSDLEGLIPDLAAQRRSDTSRGASSPDPSYVREAPSNITPDDYSTGTAAGEEKPKWAKTALVIVALMFVFMILSIFYDLYQICEYRADRLACVFESFTEGPLF